MKNSAKKIIAAIALGAATITASATPAMARHGDYGGYGYNNGYGYGYGGGRHYRGHREYRGYYGYNGYRGGYADSGYDGYNRRGYYRDGYRCRDDTAGNAVIGAVAGGLLGNVVAGRGNRAAGTVFGGALGAIAGAAASDGRRC